MVYYVKIQKYVIWRNHMILACQNISKAFGTTEIIKNASFHIEEREKAALVGINGAGKSTLLKIIIGEMRADEGEVILSKGKTMGYLAQHQDLTGHLSIYQEVLTAKQNLIDMEERLRQMESDMKTKSGAALDELLSTYTRLSHTFELENGYAYRSEVVGVLKGLGFSESDFEKQVDSLSGGQKTRVALGKLLLTKPDIILLDEPTNHLDMDSISWLETYLLNYSGAVLIVSHDRYFLDRVVTKVVEVDNKKVTTFEGNYTAYSQKKAMLRGAAYHAWVNQQQEIHHQEEVIAKLKSFNREKSIKRAESREKMLDKMDVLEKPTEVRSDMRIRLEPRITSGNDVLTVEHLSKAFPGQTLFQDLNFEIKRGERVAIIGNNGTGKTTILKILNEVIRPDAGSFTLGSRVQIGYYDQEHQVLHMEKTIFQEISDAYPYLTNTEIRNVLAAFLFTNDDVFQPIHTLSGGERGRISLAKLMLSNANFLILDEPTNHLDLEMIEWLEGYLRRGNKTLLMVTHDRYFLDEVCNLILEIDDETIYTYRGNYSYYLEKRQERIDNARAEIARANNLYRKELDWMRRQPQARGHKARYREEAFYDLEAKAKRRIEERQMRLKSSSIYIGSKIFECQYVSKAFERADGTRKVILKDFYYNFARFEKMGIVGKNGTGKSTFVKMLLGKVEPDGGRFDIGDTVRFGYFSQEGLHFREDQKVIDIVKDIADYIDLGGGRHMTASQFLNYFLFPPEMQHNYVAKLSGGVRRKLYLCTVLMRNPNFLVLDEPTNDLDIQTLQVLEEYLQDFPGCVIVISHDRYFTDKVVDHLLVFHGEGDIQDFPGNYTQYRDYQKLKSKEEDDRRQEEKKPKRERADYRNETRRKMTYKEKMEFERLEKEMGELEKEREQLEAALCSGTLSIDELTEKSKRLPEVKELIDEKEMRWLELSEIGG